MFGKPVKPAQDQKELAEAMRQMSDQIGQLSQQLAQKNQQIAQLQQQVQEGGSDAAQVSKQLAEARAEVRKLTDQTRQMKAQLESEEADDATLQQTIRELQARLAEATADDEAMEGFAVGRATWVRSEGGKSVRRRAGPGLDQAVHDGLEVGTMLALREGPVSKDGYTWWRIRTADGREGWVAGETLSLDPV